MSLIALRMFVATSFGTALNKNMMHFDLYLKQNMCNTNLIITLLLTTIN